MQIAFERFPVLDDVRTKLPEEVHVLIDGDVVGEVETLKEGTVERSPVQRDQQHERSFGTNPVNTPNIAEDDGHRMRSVIR
jgi:hypothetical protein